MPFIEGVTGHVGVVRLHLAVVSIQLMNNQSLPAGVVRLHLAVVSIDAQHIRQLSAGV